MESWSAPLSLLGALIYCTFIADFLLKTSQRLQRRILNKAYPNKKAAPVVPILPRLLGLVERILYLIAIYIQQPVFIGFWLTLKAASRWEVWASKDEKYIPGRAYFNIFLFGNGLSILYTFAAYGIILWGEHPDIQENWTLLIAAALLLLANLLLNLWLQRMVSNKKVSLTE